MNRKRSAIRGLLVLTLLLTLWAIAPVSNSHADTVYYSTGTVDVTPVWYGGWGVRYGWAPGYYGYYPGYYYGWGPGYYGYYGYGPRYYSGWGPGYYGGWGYRHHGWRHRWH